MTTFVTTAVRTSNPTWKGNSYLFKCNSPRETRLVYTNFFPQRCTFGYSLSTGFLRGWIMGEKLALSGSHACYSKINNVTGVVPCMYHISLGRSAFSQSSWNTGGGTFSRYIQDDSKLHEALCFYLQRGTGERSSTSHRLFVLICLMYYYSLQIKNGIQKQKQKSYGSHYFRQRK
jgi:hypothetical protein